MKVSTKKTNNTKKAVTKNPQKRRRAPLTELVCVLSGKIDRVNAVKLNKLVTKFKFDTTEEYIKYYISKDCIKLLRQGYTEKQIQKQFKYESSIQIPFNILKHYVKKFKNREKIEKQEKRKEVLRYMEEESGAYKWVPKPVQPIDFTNPVHVGELTKSACLRPDIYLNNDRACNGCHIYELCKCELRKWATPDEKRSRKKK